MPTDGSLRHGLGVAARRIEPHDGPAGAVDVVEVSVVSEREGEREAGVVGDAQLDRRSVRRDPIHLTGLAAAPDASVRVDGDTFRVVQANRTGRAVGEDAGGCEIEDRLCAHACPGAGRPSIVRSSARRLREVR